jgi:hypothetical protein
MPARESFGESAEVSWPLGPTTVHGTSVKPRGPGPFPAVILVAGSGPTDRDWNSPLLPGSNGSARLLAEALGRAGIASLRYDKRASGPHVRETIPLLIGKMSMQSHVDELAGAVRTMAGLILTGPPGRAVGAVARSQLAAQAAGIPDGMALLALYDAAIARFLAGEPINPDPALPDGVKLLLQSLETPANLPFARELWTADAATLLPEVPAPVLVIIGKKDVQVDWQADGEPLQRSAAEREDVTFIFPDNANHVLKHEPRPRAELVQAEVMSGYNAPDAHLDPEAEAAILAWLAART